MKAHFVLLELLEHDDEHHSHEPMNLCLIELANHNNVNQFVNVYIVLL